MKNKFNRYLKKGGANAAAPANSPLANSPVNAPANIAAPPPTAPTAPTAPTSNANSGANIPPMVKTGIDTGFDMAAKTKQFGNNITSKTNRAMNSMSKGMGIISNKTAKLTGKVDNEQANKYIIILVIAIGLILFIMFLKSVVSKYYKNLGRSPYLVEGTKSGKHAVIINQDEESINYIPINRSKNEDGMEFTYSFWILIRDLDITNPKFKHIFHKGGASSYPNRAPGVWLHPTTNTMRVYMNSTEDPLLSVDVPDIPLKKWVCVQLVLENEHKYLDEPRNVIREDKNHIMSIYINGGLKKILRFDVNKDGIPKQNNGDVYINLWGGFDGYLSKLRYYTYALDYKEIEKVVKEGPANIVTEDTGEKPPYLDNNWWFN